MPNLPSAAAAVVLNYGTVASTLSCVQNLLTSKDIRHVYVVDNASPDGSGEQLRRRLAEDEPRVTVIEAPYNGGYGAGNNVGLRRAQQQGHAAALVVNPDVVVEPDAIRAMLGHLVRPVAVVGNVLWNDAAHTQLECFGAAFYSPMTSRSRSALDEQEARQADFFSGACFVVDLAALEQAGWLPEQYFLYYEELDLVKRLARCGYRWAVAVESSALHHRGESVGSSSELGRQSLLSTYYGTRSAIVYTRTWEKRYAITVTVSRSLKALRVAFVSPRHAWAAVRGITSAWTPRSQPPGLRGTLR